MADMMQFPNTVEEFMERYKIVDTEQVYTNGAELVPIFRMKQWFDHIEGIPSAERQGRWIPQEYMSEIDSCIYTKYKCSNCGEISKKKSNYCPNCGAKMNSSAVKGE